MYLKNIRVFLLTALVDKIYRAQKERDAAVLSRLRLANGERDEVLARMKRLEQEQQGFVDFYSITLLRHTHFISYYSKCNNIFFLLWYCRFDSGVDSVYDDEDQDLVSHRL